MGISTETDWSRIKMEEIHAENLLKTKEDKVNKPSHYIKQRLDSISMTIVEITGNSPEKRLKMLGLEKYLIARCLRLRRYSDGRFNEKG